MFAIILPRYPEDILPGNVFSVKTTINIKYQLTIDLFPESPYPSYLP